MRKFLKLTAFLLVFAGVASSCNPECPPDCPDEYPQNISFTEYSLQGTSCQWQNLPYDEKVIIINSNEELEKYISCTEGGYSIIDFSKHSLLLVSGKTNKEIIKMLATDLRQLSSNKYELRIEITIKNVSVIEPWNMALVIEKVSEDKYIRLNTNLVPCPQELLKTTWVLVEKEIDGVKEMLPDEPYPVTLTFLSDSTFCGRHDANTYDGTYKMLVPNILLTITRITDVSDIEWYLNYLKQTTTISRIALTDSTMRLSNNNSLILNFVSKEKFEKDYFKLEEWYNF